MHAKLYFKSTARPLAQEASVPVLTAESSNLSETIRQGGSLGKVHQAWILAGLIFFSQAMGAMADSDPLLVGAGGAGWYRAPIGEVDVDPSGDRRTARDRDREVTSGRALQGLDPNWIYGRDLIRVMSEERTQAAGPLSSASETILSWKEFLDAHPECVSKKMQLKGEFLRRRKAEAERGLAILTLARVLDHEAAKRKEFSIEPTEQQVHYATRAILVSGARALDPAAQAEREKAKGNSKRAFSSRISYAHVPLHELYSRVSGWLGKSSISLQQGQQGQQGQAQAQGQRRKIKIQLDWNDQEDGMGRLKEDLRASGRFRSRGLPLGPVTLQFETPFRGSLIEFESQVRQQLAMIYRQELRASTLQARMDEWSDPLSLGMNSSRNGPSDWKATYERLKQHGIFLRESEPTFIWAEWTVSGPRALEWVSAWESEVKKSDDSIKSELQQKMNSGLPCVLEFSEEEMEQQNGARSAAISKRLLEARNQVTTVGVDQIGKKFKRAIQNREITLSPVRTQSGQKALFFEKFGTSENESRSILYRTERTGNEVKVSVFFEMKSVPSIPEFSELTQNELDQVKKYTFARSDQFAYRRLFFEWLEKNPYQVKDPLCRKNSEDWPCVEFELTRWMGLLMPPRFYHSSSRTPSLAQVSRDEDPLDPNSEILGWDDRAIPIILKSGLE